MPTIATLPPSTKRRWDALAADQLRAELEQVAAERDGLIARAERAEDEARRAGDWAFSEEMYRGAVQNQLTELLATARRAGICLNVRPIGMTIDGQIGLIQQAA